MKAIQLAWPHRGSWWRVGLWILLLGLAHGQRSRAIEVILDPAQSGEVFDGVGGVSAGASSRLLIDYPEPQRSEILDFLFKPGFGASFQHLKVEMGGEVNSTDGTEPTHMRSRGETNFFRGYEWWLMKEARKRNPNIALHCLAWGAPGWIGDHNFYSADMADYIISYIQGAQLFHGLDFKYCGIWNERPFSADWIKYLRRRLNESGLDHVKIVAADEWQTWNIVDEIAKDPELGQAIYAIGTHYTGSESPAAAHGKGQKVWDTEDGGSSTDWLGARQLAKILNRNYAKGRMTLTEFWALISSYYDALPLPDSCVMVAREPWSGHYEASPAFWAIAHTTQFTEPGWRYLDGPATRLFPEGGSLVALESPNRTDYSIIVETIDASRAQNVQFKVKPPLSREGLQVWRTTATAQFEHVTTLFPSGGKFSYRFEPEAIYTLSTLTNAAHGLTDPPPARPFPLPFAEDFESYSTDLTPKFLADQAGVFEVKQRADGRGQALAQVLTQQGILWRTEFMPYTLVGDRSLANYEVRSTVLLEQDGFVSLLGRVETNMRIVPSGYYARFFSTNHWELWASSTLLASGEVPFPIQVWHQVALQFDGPVIRVEADGKMLAEVRDPRHAAGLAGVGTGWNHAQFDDFAILPLHAGINLVKQGTTWVSSALSAFPGWAAADEDLNTRWIAATRWDNWWECHFREPTTVERAFVSGYWDAGTVWKIQAWAEDHWIDLVAAGTEARNTGFAFTPFTSTRFRLSFVDSLLLPRVEEIQLYGKQPSRILHFNEWSTERDERFADPLTGRAEPWFELYNQTNRELDLTGTTISFAPSDLDPFPIPAGFRVAPGGYILVWADGRIGTDETHSNQLHVPFQIENGGTLGVSSANGEVIDLVKVPNNPGGIRMGSPRDGCPEIAMLARPTPGYSNAGIRIQAAALGAGKLRFEVQAAPFSLYRIIKRASFSGGEWEPAQTVSMDAEGRGMFDEDVNGETTATFYQVVSE